MTQYRLSIIYMTNVIRGAGSGSDPDTGTSPRGCVDAGEHGYPPTAELRHFYAIVLHLLFPKETYSSFNA